MNELVFLKHKQALTTSLIIAEGTGNEHRSLIRLIQTHEEYFNRWGKVKFVNVDLKSATSFMDGRDSDNSRLSSDGRNKPTTIALLNEQQATFLITLLRNNEVVLDFKSELVDQFYKMREVLRNHQDPQWQTTRFDVKEGYKTLSAVVHDLHEFAVAHGCKVSERVFYMNFAKLLNKTLGIAAGTRDELAAWQLYEIEKLQFIARTVIKGLLAKGVDYHEPYRQTKSTLEAYARLSFIPQRLLSA